jgi:DNA-binding GntR family transcriptional regulator
MSATNDDSSSRISDTAIHTQLVEAIMDQRLQPGARLGEDKLGQAFGVSRTRIRAVLQRLANEQVVTLLPHRGASVAAPSVEDAREVFEARRLIEPTLVERFIAQAPREALQALTRCIADEERARAAGELSQAVRLSGQFHLLIAEHSGQRTLARMLAELVSRTSLILVSYAPSGPLRARPPGNAAAHWVAACGCDDHHGLLRAMRQGDGATAARRMTEHLHQLEAGLCFNQPQRQPDDLVALLRPRQRSG